jgi:VWFA-related protein
MPRRTAFLFWCLATTAQDRTFRVQSRMVQVPAVITDKSGRTIDGLLARDFLVLDNGVPQEVTVDDFAAGLPPISLVIAIQSSAISKLALAKIRRVAGMIQPLVTGQRGDAAVVSFDQEIQWLQDFTASDDKIRAAINTLKPGALSGARMFDTIVDIAARTNARRGRKILLLISQSQDAGSSAKFQQAVDAVEREDIEVFAAHYSAYAMSWIAKSEDFPDKPELDAMFFAELARLGPTNHVKALALATGGTDYSFSRQEGIENAISHLAAEVHSQYILSFPQREHSAGMHRIEVSLVHRAGLLVRARRAYGVDESEPSQ